ncbi:sulfite exporter TauE/SafE family protein [Amaricoccus sp.]|uniref:sulfite exporter TauE/SafE family protein n=1 Tax=Amaricoccus sp. TaxID=1872485 RepID=UPI001B6B9554|nr:sulfite exporter TauE/SafE family protein [Amaricoccus sp.]MBP7001217.1 sulfite exporter TauE/SafE family protein [Amaricoccus sp.]
MELTPLFFAAAVPAVLLAGISKGGLETAGGIAAAPLLALVIEPRLAVGLMLPLLMLMDLASLRAYWRKWSWADARMLMAGAIAGVVVGWMVFGAVSSDAVRLIIGCIAVGFVAWSVGRRLGLIPLGRPQPPPAGLFWGSLAGFTSFVGHAGGPPAAVYLLGRNLGKTPFQATNVVTFWWINLIKFPPYVALGMFTADTGKAVLALAPVGVAGVLIGAWAHKRVSDAWFFGLTYVVLAATGLKLIHDAVV